LLLCLLCYPLHPLCQVLHNQLQDCELECSSLSSHCSSIMGMLGASGKGKTLIANCLMLGGDNKLYLPDAQLPASLAPEKVRIVAQLSTSWTL
jgi:hypothetical protein